LADESLVQCPLCGNKVPASASKCPVCATKLKQVSSAHPSTVPNYEHLSEDFLHREIPRVVLPEAKHSCPLCALDLKGNESKCPRCGVPLASFAVSEEMLECPICKKLAPVGSNACPSCGVLFGSEQEPPSISPASPEFVPPPPVKPEPLPQRPMPEIIPATPAPAPSRQGLVNGRGAINGTGMVNGTGIINGTRGGRAQARSRQRSFMTRWQFLAIMIAIVVIVPTFIYLSYSREGSAFAVDGDFREWSKVDTFSALNKSGTASIDIDEWAVSLQDEGLFMYLRTDGNMMTSSDVDSFYLFIDADNSQSSGYEVSGIGADCMLQIDGWNGSVQSTAVSEFPSDGDRLNWNDWDSRGSMSVSAAGRQLEGLAILPVSITPESRFLLISQNSMEQNSLSYAVPAKGGLLVIAQEPGSAIGTDGMVPQTAGVAILRLRVTCDGADGTIDSISGGLSSAPLSSPIDVIDLYVGEEKIIDVMVDTSAAAEGSSVFADISLATIASSFAEVQIIGDGVAAYVGSVPSTIVIDGAFGDWVGRTTADSDPVPNKDRNIDIASVGAANDTTASYFYVSVVGGMCLGSYVPAIKQVPVGGGGGGIFNPPRLTGEDILNIYIDSDMSSASGYPVSLSSKLIGADQKIEIRGLNGHIVSRSLMVYSAGLWTFGSASISAENDDQRLEVSISSASLNGASSIEYIIETTDWRSRTDLATSVPQGTRALSGGLPTGASLDGWVVDSSTSSSSATAMSYQRKLFYDGLNFWSFFFDGTDTMYKWSNTSGQTWSTSSRAFSTAGVDEASVWYNSITRTVFIVGDYGAASRVVHVRQGTVTSSPAGIAWTSNDQTPTVSSANLGGKNTYVSQDSSGYLWILASNCTSPGNYDLSAFRSRTANTTTTNQWFCTGNMLNPDGTQFNLKGSIVPASAGVMWAVYAYEGNVASRKYSGGSWSVTEIPIYTIADDVKTDRNPANTDLAPPSVVIDAKDVVHVLFGNGHEKGGGAGGPIPHTYYGYYSTGGSWVLTNIGTTDVKLGNFYPTLSLDQATGNLYAFWIESNPLGSYYTLMCRKNTTGTWTSYNLVGETTFAKQYLTSVYSATNENLIAWQWTQNTTAVDVEVQFDKIPEFHDIAPPILMMMGMFALLYRRSRARGRESKPEL
jgi:hypothetical protein